jgi:hypothetical protein
MSSAKRETAESKSAPERRTGKCPKCGAPMVDGTCTKCKFSEKTAYQSLEQAKEFTHPG